MYCVFPRVPLSRHALLPLFRRLPPQHQDIVSGVGLATGGPLLDLSTSSNVPANQLEDLPTDENCRHVETMLIQRLKRRADHSRHPRNMPLRTLGRRSEKKGAR